MNKELIIWDIYEVRPSSTPVTWVSFRWRLRKFAVEKNINLLVENTEDIVWSTRFALISWESSEEIKSYIFKKYLGTQIELVMKDTPNPILSKLRTNIESRYELSSE